MKYLAFIGIALLVALPWFLQPGYLLLLDWQGYPAIPAIHLDQTGGISSIPVQIILTYMSHIVGVAYAQKIFLLVILFVAGYATALLVRTISPTMPNSVMYVAGIFAMLNPFVYNRIHMGHIYLLAAYALTPLAILFLLRFLKKPSVLLGLYTSTICGLIILTSIHHLILLPFILFFFAWNAGSKEAIPTRSYLALIAPFFCIAVLVAIVAITNPTSALQNLSPKDMVIFAPVAQCSHSILLDSALLAAQWRNPGATHAPCTSLLVFTSELLLLCIMILGAFQARRLAIGAILCIILASIPLIPAMRDSAKFLADLAFIQSTLLALGLATLHTTRHATAVKTLALILVCIMGFPMLWGLYGTVIPREYPTSWYEWNTQLSTMQPKPIVLFLPWHLYMPFTFTNGATIANPATNFFTNATIIQGDNLEITQGKEHVATTSKKSISRAVEHTLLQLHTASFPEAFKTLLTQEHIQYIALAHGSPEQEEYTQVLNTLPYLRPQMHASGLSVWHVEE